MTNCKNLILTLCAFTAFASAQDTGRDWPVYGNGISGDNSSPAPTGITAANLKSLTRRQVKLDGAVDSSVIYLHAVNVKGASHDTYFMTTIYGKSIAVDAGDGSILWEYTPEGYARWAGTPQFSTASPVADPDRTAIYATTPGGDVVKLAVSDGHLLWSTSVTPAPASEKLPSPLILFRGRLIVVTGGYGGDRPPYVGHVAILDAASGRISHVWNTLCSDKTGLIDPRTCEAQRSAIWGRSGPVIDPATGNIFVATGNGNYDGKTSWSNSLIELDPDATKMLGNWTPENEAEINRGDLDLITSPVLMGDGVIAQSGKDNIIRLLDLKAIAGTEAHNGRELQTVTGQGSSFINNSLAKWTHNGTTWLFIAAQKWRGSGGGIAAWTYKDRKLTPVWKNDNPATVPVLAGGLLYAYNGNQGGLHVYNPETGEQVGELATGTGHWGTPVAIDGRIALTEGNANDRPTSGVLDIWSLPVTDKSR